MKLKCDITVEGRGTRDEGQKRAPFSTLDSRLSTTRSAVALIITLILLSVVTFMALTFLAVSRRERGAVTTGTDTASARLAADDALASAEGEIVANILANNNPYNFGLLASTNYINPGGFQTAGPGYASYTNVNYYYPNGFPVAGNDFLQLMANLYYLPRVPVYMSNLVTSTMENRFYLDLNRNGVDDPNGWVPEIGNNGLPIVNGGVTNYVYEVGDPEWVGVLQHPDQPYGPNNLFVARYAFIAVPIGNALDLNHIFNQVFDESEQFGVTGKGVPVNPSVRYGSSKDAFLRNQGVGSWEINLAAFLADLNTNEWGQVVGSGLGAPPASATWYQYNQAIPTPPGSQPNLGSAFDDARALLAYRYQNNYLSLKPGNLLFFNLPPNFPLANTVPFDNIDEYSDGPLQTAPPPINEVNFPGNRDNPSLSWAGAPNTNHFFSVDDLFDPNKANLGAVSSVNSFTNRLLTANNSVSTYNRYTFYRLLSQMGVESTPEQNKLNLNYVNVDNSGNVVPNMETNLIPWTNALQFFTNAADRMLRDYSQEWLVESPSNYLATYGSFTNISTAPTPGLNPTNMPLPFGISHIPVFVNNQFVYKPAVQRVLQLAANIYDATTNSFFPSVFRPIFWVTNEYGYTNVYVNGYEQVVSVPFGTNDPQLALPVEVTDLINPNPNPPYPFGFGPNLLYTNVNVYGVPWIVGAKKGFPNFNEFAMESVFQLTRKLQVTRPSTNATPDLYQYNQMFLLSVSNQFGVECWNSYTNGYQPNNDSMVIYVRDNLRHAALTNDENFSTDLPVFPIAGSIQIPNGNINIWPGYNPVTDPIGSLLSFQIPLYTNVTVITNSMYRFNNGAPFLTTNLALDYEQNVVNPVTGASYPQPHWILISSNEVQVFMLDTTANRVIDYVQLSGPSTVRDLTSEIISQYDTQPGPNGNDLWNTNIQNNLPIGLISLIGVSLGNYTPGAGSGNWDTTDETLRENEVDGFRAFFGYSPIYNNVGAQEAIAKASSTNYTQAPYLPTATVVQHFSWQANDPLVHYTASDLNWSGANLLNRNADDLTNENLGQLNQRYMPWGGNPIQPGADKNPFSLSIKDPLVRQSDDWDFPTYKFPNVGWLGRVHRGTPWQTVYLKAPDALQGIQVTGGVTNYVGTNVWAQWTGDTQLANSQNYDAINTAPVQDRRLFDVFTTALNDNATRGQLSVNVDAGNPSPQAGLAAWSAMFGGVIVLSNNAVDAVISTNVVSQHAKSMTNFTWFPINPAGPGGPGSALGQLVAGINQTRTNFVNADGLAGSFENVGDILAVPQLTVLSPFLNWNDPVQQANGISDEMYEWLPEQVMSLLHVSDAPRFVIYSYGQALKPAPNGIYTGGGPFFGMVTNYQVVAEAATRSVVRFNGTRVDSVVLTNEAPGVNNWISVPSVTNNNVVIEQSDVLPSN